MTGGGNYIVISIFISEISDPSIRGALSSMAMLFLSFGMIAGFLLSSHVDYYLNPCIILIFPIIYLLGVSYFSETPQHLLRKQRIAEARAAFRFYKNLPKDAKIDSIAAKQREVEMDAEFEELKQNILSNNGQSQVVTYKDYLNAEALKSFFTVFMLLFINQFCGSFAFFNYMSDIFAVTGTDIPPNTCTTVVGVAQTTGIFLTMILSDRFGRKLLMLISTGGMAVGIFIFGLYIQFASAQVKLEYNWFPLVIMSFIVLVASIGIVGLLFTIIVENLPPKIRSSATSMSMGCLSFLVFLILKIFPLMLKTYGLACVLYCCGSVSLVGWFYVLLCLQETKGKYLDK